MLSKVLALSIHKAFLEQIELVTETVWRSFRSKALFIPMGKNPLRLATSDDDIFLHASAPSSMQTVQKYPLQKKSNPMC